MTTAIKTRKRTKASVLAEINGHLLDNTKGSKNSWKLVDYNVDLYCGENSAILEKNDSHYNEDEVTLFTTEEFSRQCGATVFCDFLPDSNPKAPILLEHLLRNIKTFVDKTDCGTTVFCTTVNNSVADKVIKKVWGEPFLTQKNPNTRHIINYYYKII